MCLPFCLQVRLRYAPLRLLYVWAYWILGARCGIANPLLMSFLTNGLCLAVNGYTDWHARSRFLRTWNGKMNATADVKDDSARSSVETADAAASSSTALQLAAQSTGSDDDETSDTIYISPLGERVTVSTQLLS